MKQQISILGLGWLGLPTACKLLEHDYLIKGSTTSAHKIEKLQDKGIDTYQIELTEEGPVGNMTGFLEGSEILLINVPPGLRRNPEVNFVAKIESVLPFIEKSTVQNVLFISSTSVFADIEGFPLISQETLPNATSNAGKQLIKTEQLLQNNKRFHTTVLRFAGLFGPERHPANMLSRRSNIKNPKAPVNLIHLEDCIGVISTIIKTDQWNTVFNASYPDHPEKAIYYSKVCEQLGLPQPDYDFESTSKGKIIVSDEIQQDLGYSFQKDLETK